MSNYVLFNMDDAFRSMLIANHRFYADQARRRLLSQFNDMKGDADKASDAWLAQQGHHFDPDRDDPGSFYERAYDEGIAHYQLLVEMRRTTFLAVLAGMYHEWDKQLREWIAGEISHWHRGPNVRAQVWSQHLGGLAELLAAMGWDMRNAPYFGLLDACRLVVNVYKHGEGDAFEQLKLRYPQYIVNPLQGWANLDPGYFHHREVEVTLDQIDGFSDAIVAFWGAVPSTLTDGMVGQLPKWFEKALKKDGNPSP